MKLNSNTKKAQNFINSYKQSHITDLYDAYGRPSRNKYSVWLNCQENCNENNGGGLKIISYNTSFFTIGFITKKGEQIILNINTGRNKYEIELE